MMLVLTAVWFYLAVAAADSCSQDGGFAALANAFGSNSNCGDSSSLMKALLGNDQCSSGRSCCECQNTCNQCSNCYHCCQKHCEAPPSEPPAFPVEVISETPNVTPMCFEKENEQIKKLLKYLEHRCQETQCTNLCKFMKNMQHYAHLYSLLYGRNLCRFPSKRYACGRALLRTNEAMLSIFSKLARVSTSCDYNMRMAKCCVDCKGAPCLIAETVKVYTKGTLVLMSKVTKYLESQERIMTKDPILCLADQIALLTIQLSTATAEFLKSPVPCSKKHYCESITGFKKNLETLDDITTHFKDADSDELEVALALMGHGLSAMIYEIKVDTSYWHASGMHTEFGPMEYPQKVAQVYKAKDAALRDIMDRLDTTDVQERGMLTKIVVSDVQLFTKTTRLMSLDRCKQMIAFDVHTLTKVPLMESFVKENNRINKPLAVVTQLLVQYVNTLLDLLQIEGAQEVAQDSGFKDLQSHVEELFTENKIWITATYLQVLLSSIKTPACHGEQMPKGHFAPYRQILQEMTSSAHAMYQALLTHTDIIDAHGDRIVKEMTESIEESWQDLYGMHLTSCANHDCFAFHYIKRSFEITGLTWVRVTDTGSLDRALDLISAQKQLLRTLLRNPHPLKMHDTSAIEQLQEAYEKMLQAPNLFKADFMEKVQAIKGKMSQTESACHTAVTQLFRAMLEIYKAL